MTSPLTAFNELDLALARITAIFDQVTHGAEITCAQEVRPDPTTGGDRRVWIYTMTKAPTL